MTMVTATFRFYAELNDFLPPARRQKSFCAPCARAATTKHMIEALGVPHTEVDWVVVNGEFAGLDHLIAEGDRIAVYPQIASMEIAPLRRLQDQSLRETRFIADAHLGGLARHLRMAGFDTLYDNAYHDEEVESLSLMERRIVLTRDRELLKRRTITHGCYVRALRSAEQFREIVLRLDLAGSFAPFTRCLHCNVVLVPVAKGDVADRVPSIAYAFHDRYSACPACQRVYWEGTHWQHMQEGLRSVLEETAPALSSGPSPGG